jgi:hypothetical protein
VETPRLTEIRGGTIVGPRAAWECLVPAFNKDFRTPLAVLRGGRRVLWDIPAKLVEIRSSFARSPAPPSTNRGMHATRALFAPYGSVYLSRSPSGCTLLHFQRGWPALTKIAGAYHLRRPLAALVHVGPGKNVQTPHKSGRRPWGPVKTRWVSVILVSP